MFESTEVSQVRALKYDDITKSATFNYRYILSQNYSFRCDKAFVVAIDLKAHVKFVHDREDKDDSDSNYRIRIEKWLWDFVIFFTQRL